MFFLMFTDNDLRLSSALLATKFAYLGDQAEQKMFNPILSGTAPEGWRKEQMTLSSLSGNHEIRIFRSNRFQEQIVIITDDLEAILHGHQFFEQGNTVNTMYQNFRVALLRFAEKIVDQLLHTEPRTSEEANMLKRCADNLYRNWKLSEKLIDRPNGWASVMQNIELLRVHAVDQLSYFPSNSVTTIQATRDVNIAGRDIVQASNGNAQAVGGDMSVTKPKGILWQILIGLTIALAAGGVLYMLGWN